MKISYDYTELISELKEEVRVKRLNLTDEIYIERKEEPLPDGYRIVKHWQRESKVGLERINLANLLIELEEVNSIF